jgi:hypothetical protein
VRVAVRSGVLDARLQVSAGDVDGAGDLARGHLLGLADVDDHEIVVADLVPERGGLGLADGVLDGPQEVGG